MNRVLEEGFLPDPQCKERGTESWIVKARKRAVRGINSAPTPGIGKNGRSRKP